MHDYLVLYGLVRTEMASMTRGMVGAHMMHAQSHASFLIEKEKEFGEKWAEQYDVWTKQTNQGFGTAMTLDLVDIGTIQRTVELAKRFGFPAAVTHDPTYPVIDGKVVHLVPTDTGGWIFGLKSDLYSLLKDFPLCS